MKWRAGVGVPNQTILEPKLGTPLLRRLFLWHLLNCFLVWNHCMSSIKSQWNSRHSLVCWTLMSMIDSVDAVVVDNKSAQHRSFYDYLFPLCLRYVGCLKSECDYDDG